VSPAPAQIATPKLSGPIFDPYAHITEIGSDHGGHGATEFGKYRRRVPSMFPVPPEPFPARFFLKSSLRRDTHPMARYFLSPQTPQADRFVVFGSSADKNNKTLLFCSYLRLSRRSARTKGDVSVTSVVKSSPLRSSGNMIATSDVRGARV